MNTPTDTYKEINMFRLFLRTYFYNQYQYIIESNIKKLMPPISSITWDPNNYEYKIVTTSKDYKNIDFNHIINQVLLSSLKLSDIYVQILRNGSEPMNDIWKDIMNYDILKSKYISTLYRCTVFPNVKTIYIML